jgi:pyruvate kinase
MRHPYKRFTKILATLGPATTREAQINELMNAGVDAFRLNFSHGNHQEHKERYEIIKKLEKKKGKYFGVIADMQGPKLRIGVFENERVVLKDGQKFKLDLNKKPGNEKRVELPHPEIFKSLKKGTKILLNDGRIQFEVIKSDTTEIECKVIYGGELSDRKGFNIPNTVLDIPILTKKDLKDLDFALKLGINMVAVSFVQTPEDLHKVKKIVKDKAKIISKLEKPSAIDNLEEIVKLSDMIMVARGDLAVETSPEDVPVLQKQIIHECHKQGRPVIVATQMLESMINSPVPTRAEASDVANAIFDGTDAVMLSAETAAGNYPDKAVLMMDKIISKIETNSNYQQARLKAHETLINGMKKSVSSKSEAIIIGTKEIAEKVDAKAVVAFTQSGDTALMISKYKPFVPVIAVTENTDVAREMALVYGINPYILDEKVTVNFDNIEEMASYIVKKIDVAKKRNLIIITAGKPVKTSGKLSNILKKGSTNILNIVNVV